VRSACTMPHIVPTQHPLAPPARAGVRYWAGVSSPHLRCGAGVGRHTWAGVPVSCQDCSELAGGGSVPLVSQQGETRDVREHEGEKEAHESPNDDVLYLLSAGSRTYLPEPQEGLRRNEETNC